MPLHESEAIVLQNYPLGEADRLVSFLSRTMGRMRGVAAGARKPKSRFGSTLERLSHVRIWFHERETRELVRINQCEIIESFIDAFGDYDSSVVLALFSEVTQLVLPDREVADANFRLLLLVSQAVKRTGKPELPLAYFSLWSVKLGGWLPALDRCAKCGRTIASGESAHFLPRGSQVFCGQCKQPGSRTLSAAALSAAKRILGAKLDTIGDEIAEPRALRELTNCMLDIIEQQIDRKLSSRELLEAPSK
jgi:DNA repair protein RecO (recombination protein O)